jgi:hypothetical protein
MLQQTFFQKVFLTIMSGFAAACLLYLFRHIVSEAIWENSAGWKESLYQKSTPARKVR